MNRRKCESLMNVIYRPIEIFPLCLWSMVIVLAIHYLEIISELLFDYFSHESFGRFWIDRLSSFPIELCLLVKETMISYSVGGCLINVFNLISVLMRSTTLIEEFLKLSMVVSIVFTVSNLSSVVPSWNFSRSWHINAFLKPVHFI
jgi:hypothetical protein